MPSHTAKMNPSMVSKENEHHQHTSQFALDVLVEMIQIVLELALKGKEICIHQPSSSKVSANQLSSTHEPPC